MTRQARIAILAGVAGLAVLAVVLALVLGGDDDEEPASGGGRAGQSLYSGIPQRGEVLGRADAPLVVMEFADVQCPFCRDFSVNALPAIVDEYLRPGRIRMQLRLLAFLGPDSERGARAAYAAALQNKMWEFVERFYANQGPENSGYATDEFLRERAAEVPGLDVERLLRDRDSPRVSALLQSVEADATELGVDATPSFYAGPDAERVRVLRPEGLDAESFRAALDAALGA